MVTVTIGGRNNQECGRVSRKEAQKQEPIIDFHSLQSQMDEPNKPRIYNKETLERLTQEVIASLPESDIKYEVTICDDMVATIRPYRETFTFTVVVKDE